MAPNISNVAIATGVLHETDDEIPSSIIPPTVKNPEKREFKIVWKNIIMFLYLHLGGLYGLYLMFFSAKIVTSIFGIVLHRLGLLGITGGAHRLWAHKSYKAKWPLRLFLAFTNTLAYQDPVVDWARDHRVHHKYSETDADPHNAKRGFFFSHIGWLLCRKHPEVKLKGKNIDISDLYADPILRFQKKYYGILVPLIAFILPTLIPMYYWNESFMNAFSINIFRYILTLNVTFLVNSLAHMNGDKPYDRFINPSQHKIVALLAMGEGWHNYHHTFPWDYKTSERGKYSINSTLVFIDLMAKMGLAYDLKSVSEDVIKKRVARTGDGSHEIWGWGDKDQPAEDKHEAIITYKKNAN